MNNSIPLNFRLVSWLAWKSLGCNRMTTVATILGVAIGMTVVGAILILDANTAHTPAQLERLASEMARRAVVQKIIDSGEDTPLPVYSLDSAVVKKQLSSSATGVFVGKEGARQPVILGVDFIRNGDHPSKTPSSTQKGKSVDGGAKPKPAIVLDQGRGQIMRIAVRISSIMAFFIGAVIVFYTMRFSLTKRGREFALLRCLGESRTNVALSLLVETVILGVAGSLLGLLLSITLAYRLRRLNISTTGMTPLEGFAIPWGELSWLVLLGLLVAVLGVAGPVWTQFRAGITDMLQPGFISRKPISTLHRLQDFSWLIPPIFGVSYLAARPFLFSSLSVIQFFAIELLVILILVFTTLLLVRPLVWQLMRISEWLFKPLFPLETLLTGHRIRQESNKLLFSIAGIILVFSLLLALYSIINVLQTEMRTWIAKASEPYGFYRRIETNLDSAKLPARLHKQGIAFFRLSDRLSGKIPLRVIHSEDVNMWFKQHDKPLLTPGKIIFSSYLAARFKVVAGDVLRLQGRDGYHLFTISAIDDSIGFFPLKGSYKDLKQFALVSEGNALFRDNLDPTLGRWAVARTLEPEAYPNYLHRDVLRRKLPAPEYRFSTTGDYLGWLPWEIRKDLLIFDFILYMTVLMACMGVANTMLIQVYGRRREMAILKTIGIGRRTVIQLVLVEGFMVGMVSAVFVSVLGNAIGAVGIRFLERFTSLGYTYEFTIGPQIGITILILICCGLAAIYPALAATRISSAESLHYE